MAVLLLRSKSSYSQRQHEYSTQNLDGDCPEGGAVNSYH